MFDADLTPADIAAIRAEVETWGEPEPLPVWILGGDDERTRQSLAGQILPAGPVQKATKWDQIPVGQPSVLVRRGDELRPDAIYRLQKALREEPRLDLAYGDEQTRDGLGGDEDRFFKPDWDPFLAWSSAYAFSGAILVRPSNLAAGEVLSPLSVLELLPDRPKVIHLPRVLTRVVKPSYDAADADAALVSRRLASQGIRARTTDSGLLQLDFPLPEPVPKVSILIPTRDHSKVLEKCLTSLFDRTDYPAFEVIVIDNGSAEEETRLLLERFAEKGVRVLRDDEPFNYPRLNNRAAEIAEGELLCLLNNDTEIVQPDWLRRLAALAVRSDVGAVGARLLFPDETVQHGGVAVFGYEPLCVHLHYFEGREDSGYHRLGFADRTVSAVTAACLVVRKDLYQAVGMLDPEFAVAYNDMDFCMRVREEGLRNVYAGSVTLFHHESVSRGKDLSGERGLRAKAEVELFKKRWRGKLVDPFYNPNLGVFEWRTFLWMDRFTREARDTLLQNGRIPYEDVLGAFLYDGEDGKRGFLLQRLAELAPEISENLGVLAEGDTLARAGLNRAHATPLRLSALGFRGLDPVLGHLAENRADGPWAEGREAVLRWALPLYIPALFALREDLRSYQGRDASHIASWMARFGIREYFLDPNIVAALQPPGGALRRALMKLLGR